MRCETVSSNKLEVLKKILENNLKSNNAIIIKNNDIYVKTKDREKVKEEVEKYLEKKKVNFKSVAKKSKSETLEVLNIPDFKTDIVFKPMIAKGQGGVAFEIDIETDLNNYFAGAEMKEIKHQDVISEMIKVLDLPQSLKYSAKREGSKNQTRDVRFSGNSLDISNTSGKTLTDVTIQKEGRDVHYLSLKLSQSYYVLSAAVERFFIDKNIQTNINEFFGFDGLKMIGFGDAYACETKPANYATVSANLADLLKQAIGTNVVFVHKKKNNDVLVKDIGTSNQVTINGLNEDSYSYPEAGRRKGGSIKVSANINGARYKVDFQFRGTRESDTGAKYLRILLERL